VQVFVDTKTTRLQPTIKPDGQISAHYLRHCPVELEIWLAVAKQEIQYGRPEQALSIIGQLFLQFDKQADALKALPHGSDE
jgi:hypothetical protein